MRTKSELIVKGRKLQVSSLEKVLFPETGFTKAELIDYYIRVGPTLLPHLRSRPLTLKLYLNKVNQKPEYIKEAPSYTPKWVKRAAVWRRDHSSQIHYLLLNDLPSLIWAANLNNIELHVLLAQVPLIQKPKAVVFDLDPGEPATVFDCARAALLLKELLSQIELEAFVKSSGSKGLHLWIPLNTNVTYEQTQAFAKAISEHLEKMAPDLVITEMAKAARSGKVFIDYSQNADFKTTAAVYSLRARPDGPFVSFPLTWTELEFALQKRDASRFFLRPDEAIERVEAQGDPFAPVLKLNQKLPKTFDKLPEAKDKPGAVDGNSKPFLKQYRAKRRFDVTAEPEGKASRAKAEAGLLFVIQKHAARNLHYDFRLEMQGVLRSWAVPKGPPLLKGERRLAMHVEDHPMEYARFEGVIPKGQYGGGTVMVWDIGTYEAKDEHPVKAFHSGTLHLRLHGEKLKGDWTLVRLKAREGERGNSWLLIKSGADAKPISKSRLDKSVLTKRTMDEIAQEQSAVWESNR